MGAALATPRGLALACMTTYLLATGAMLAVGGHGGLALLHAALVVVTAVTLVPATPFLRFAGDVLPLLVVPALYAELPSLIGVAGAAYRDSWAQGVELALFGGQPSRQFARAVPLLIVSEVLHAGYLAYYPLIFVPPLLLLRRGDRAGFGKTVLALTATYLICWIAFVCFPVQGPRYLWGPSASPNGPVRTFTNAILAAGSSRGTAFPSSHMAVSAAQAVCALRYQPRIGWLVLVLAIMVGLGAVYGGFHYATDVLTGAALGAGVAALVVGRN